MSAAMSGAAEASRSPHGERGLKFDILIIGVNRSMSLSSWRAWIEIMSTLIIA